MLQNTLRLDVLIHASPEDIIHYLMQPENYTGLQPFVVSSRTLEHGYDEHGRAFVHYTAVERVPLVRFLRLSTPLDVVTTVTQPGAQLLSVVKSSMSSQVEFTYDFQVSGPQTLLMLCVTARTPHWLKGFVLARARQAQTVVLSNLKQQLDTPRF